MHRDHHLRLWSRDKFLFSKLSKGQKGTIPLKQGRKTSSHKKKSNKKPTNHRIKITGKNTLWERTKFKSKVRRTDLSMLWLLSHLFPVYFCLLCFATHSRSLIFSNLNKELWFVLSNNFTHSRCRILFGSIMKAFCKLLQKQSKDTLFFQLMQLHKMTALLRYFDTY